MGKYEGRNACPQFPAKENKLSQFILDLPIFCDAFDASPSSVADASLAPGGPRPVASCSPVVHQSLIA